MIMTLVPHQVIALINIIGFLQSASIWSGSANGQGVAAGWDSTAAHGLGLVLHLAITVAILWWYRRKWL